MGDHALGMDAGIGSTGPVQVDGLSGYPLQGAFYFTLDSAPLFLALPAAEAGTVVTDDQLESARKSSWHCGDGSRKEWDDAETGGFRQAAHDIHILDGLAGGPLDNVIDHRHDDDSAGGRINLP